MAIDQIEEVKQKLDIVDLVSSYIPLAKSGKNYKALCPFHSEKTPSFMVSPQLQIFKCFGCGEGGDVIAFYSKMEGVNFGEALKEMAKRAGVKLLRVSESPEEQKKEQLYQINNLAADYFHFLLTKHKVGAKALEFLKGRQVSSESIETFNLGYSPDSWDSLGRFILSKGFTLTEFLQSGLGVRKDPSTSSRQRRGSPRAAGQGRGYYDFFRGRVMFPLRSPSGKVAGFSGRTLGDDQPKYINGVDTPIFAKGHYLYNFDLAKQEIKREKNAVLVEGELDAIALYEKGIKNVVAAKGTALSPDQISPLARFAQRLVICFDPDTAGLEATKKGLFLAQSVGLEVTAALLPAGKDPDEAVREDAIGFKKLLEKAPPIFDFYLSSALTRFDLKTPKGKKEIAHELLPVLKSLANEVEKAAYLAKLSDKLDVSEEVLWKQLAREEPLEVDQARRSDQRSEVGSPTVASGLPKKEAYLLTVLLTLPEEKLERALRRAALVEITDPRLQEIISTLIAYLKKVKKFHLERFPAKLGGDARRIFEELTLAPPLEDVNPEKEFAKALGAVKRVALERGRKELVTAVRKAEKEKASPSEVRRLQKEILKLIKEIDRSSSS